MSRALARLGILMFLLAPLAAAGPGHQGPTPVEQTMFVHFFDGPLLLSPLTPASYVLNDAATAPPACGSTHSWQAAFTPDTPAAAALPGPLVRAAEFDVAQPTIKWYLEAVLPSIGSASPIPLPSATFAASIRTGNDLQVLGDGTALAEATEALTPAATSVDGVYVLEMKLPWTDAPTVPVGDLQLEVTLAFGPDQCTSALPGVRAYADQEMIPGIQWFLFDPIRIDALSGAAKNGTATITLEASSPWGPLHFAPIKEPTLQGGSGPVTGLQLQSMDAARDIRAVWTWAQAGAPNGTYRAEIQLQDVNAASQYVDSVVFKMGDDDAPKPVMPAAPSKDSPTLSPVMVLVAVALLAVMKKRARI